MNTAALQPVYAAQHDGLRRPVLLLAGYRPRFGEFSSVNARSSTRSVGEALTAQYRCRCKSRLNHCKEVLDYYVTILLPIPSKLRRNSPMPSLDHK